VTPSYVYDGAYNDRLDCPYYPVEFVEGMQHMDGETALAYARLRKATTTSSASSAADRHEGDRT
jgi:anionic cell wall polymer biosynthesis LytR-Cps2A-Psr (LCP) family protein